MNPQHKSINILRYLYLAASQYIKSWHSQNPKTHKTTSRFAKDRFEFEVASFMCALADVANEDVFEPENMSRIIRRNEYNELLNVLVNFSPFAHSTILSYFSRCSMFWVRRNPLLCAPSRAACVCWKLIVSFMKLVNFPV